MGLSARSGGSSGALGREGGSPLVRTLGGAQLHFSVPGAERALQGSLPRDSGGAWSKDHRRVLIGRRNLFRARTRRSTSR